MVIVYFVVCRVEFFPRKKYMYRSRFLSLLFHGRKSTNNMFSAEITSGKFYQRSNFTRYLNDTEMKMMLIYIFTLKFPDPLSQADFIICWLVFVGKILSLLRRRLESHYRTIRANFISKSIRVFE